MKNIKTLVKDIYDLFDNDVQFDRSVVRDFGNQLADTLAARLAERKEGSHLRISNLGKACKRQLWYSINTPELGEKLDAPTRIKFLIGDITEAFVLFLAKVAGHTVERQGEEIEINGVKGHIDAVVDGELVDSKSASSYSFKKFKEHRLEEDDPFGYVDQIGAYGSKIGTGKDHFLVMDKQHGHLVLDSWPKSKKNYEKVIDETRELLSSNTPPERGYSDEPYGLSGNRKLGVGCSYCSFKATCWPGLRTIPYSTGPVHFTVVKREPKPRTGQS